MGNGILMLLSCPLWGEFASETEEEPKPIFFVECSRFMALRNGRMRKVRSRARFYCVHRSAAETLDGFFRLCQARGLKRGHSHEKEIWWNYLFLSRISGAGVARQEQAPLRRAAEDVRTQRRQKHGGDFLIKKEDRRSAGWAVNERLLREVLRDGQWIDRPAM